MVDGLGSQESDGDTLRSNSSIPVSAASNRLVTTAEKNANLLRAIVNLIARVEIHSGHLFRRKHLVRVGALDLEAVRAQAILKVSAVGAPVIRAVEPFPASALSVMVGSSSVSGPLIGTIRMAQPPGFRTRQSSRIAFWSSSTCSRT